MKAIRILFLVIFSVVALGALSSCSDTPQEDCYKKNVKELEKANFSKAKSAQIAKARCY